MIDFACKQFSLKEIIKCGLGLTRAELQILEYMLNCEQYLSTSQLATKVKLDESTIQRAVKKLYEAKIVIRRQENFAGGGYQYIYAIASREEIAKKLLATIDTWRAKVKVAFDEWK